MEHQKKEEIAALEKNQALKKQALELQKQEEEALKKQALEHQKKEEETLKKHQAEAKIAAEE